MESPEQATKLIELAKLKAELSTNYYSIETYKPLIEKILSPTELLTQEECQQATSKEFAKAVTGMAQSIAKVTTWHSENKKEEATAFLFPAKTIEQTT